MRLENINISYGPKVIFRDFAIGFTEGTITAILGPSGCGKTTLLHEIALRNSGNPVSFIFQEPRLIPWLTIEKNITLVLRGSASGRRERARHYLSRVGLIRRAGEYPGNLSGGERQRASIARAFSVSSDVLLMDEPFQSQDPGLKNQLIDLVKKLQSEERRTIVSVTHDVHDAVIMAERAVIINGRPVSIVLDIPVVNSAEATLTEVLSCQMPVW